MAEENNIDPASLSEAEVAMPRRSPASLIPRKEFGFYSDELIEKFPNLGELLDPDPEPRVFLSSTQPHFAGGLRVVAKCPEFRLIQTYGPEGPWVVELNCNIDRLYTKSKTGVNDREDVSTWERRASLAVALKKLSIFTSHNRAALVEVRDQMTMTDTQLQSANKKGYPGATLVHLAATLGLAMDKIGESEDPKRTIDEIVALFESSLMGFARSEDLFRDKRRKQGPRPHEIIDAASAVFARRKERPSRSDVITLLGDGARLGFSGKDTKGKWKDAFNCAGLGGLPD